MRMISHGNTVADHCEKCEGYEDWALPAEYIKMGWSYVTDVNREQGKGVSGPQSTNRLVEIVGVAIPRLHPIARCP